MRTGDLLLTLHVLKDLRQRKTVGREEGCMHSLDVLKKFGFLTENVVAAAKQVLAK